MTFSAKQNTFNTKTDQGIVNEIIHTKWIRVNTNKTNPIQKEWQKTIGNNFIYFLS